MFTTRDFGLCHVSVTHARSRYTVLNLGYPHTHMHIAAPRPTQDASVFRGLQPRLITPTLTRVDYTCTPLPTKTLRITMD